MGRKTFSSWRIPLFKIYWEERHVSVVADVIRSGMQWASGSKVKEFEEAISNYIGTKYAVTFNSGTSALHATLLAYGIKESVEVIVPSFTFIATANAPLFVGAKPVFADIEKETFGLDPEDVKEKINNRTKAIIPVHYGGCPCKIRELKEIAEDHKILLIEDAAEAFGAKINNRKVGTFGDSAILSFCQNKIITTGEGGAVLIDDEKIYNRLRLIRSHGRLEVQDYFSSIVPGKYITLGYNFRLSNILAALGLSQLKDADKIIRMRREKALMLSKKLSGINHIRFQTFPSSYFHVYQMFTIRVDQNLRDDLMNYLSSKGIMTKVYFEPVHLTRLYRRKFGYKGGELPVTEQISREVLTLPMYPTLSEQEIDYLFRHIKEFFRERI